MILQEKYNDYQIILASNSPRRKQFLKDLGLTFTVKPANVNEEYPSQLQGKDIALYIAQQKASVFYQFKHKRDGYYMRYHCLD